jgi:hypothetical protein
MSFLSAVADALRLADRGSQTAAVHDVVRNGLRQVAPGVEVRTTDYFTHTFVPDLVLAWGPEDRRLQRNVHLRFVVSDNAFLDEVDFLASTAPMFLGLLDTNPIADLTSGNGAADRRADTLVTQSASVDALQEGQARDQRTVTATREVVRGGRGSIGPDLATQLIDQYHQSLQAIEILKDAETEAADSTRTALTLLRDALRSREFAAVENDLRSRWIRQGGDPFTFPAATSWDPQAVTREELGEVLNSLLDSGRDVPVETWSRNAWFLSAQELAEALGKDRRGGALNQLAAALLPNWTAQWVWAETLDLPLQITLDWLISERTLAIEIGDMRAAFRDDGRRFKDKKPRPEPLPTVDDMVMVLRDPNVRAADLHSSSEDISYSYRATGDQALYDRLLDLIAPSQRLGLRVSNVQTIVPGRQDIADIDLARQVIDLDKTPTPISVLVRLAMAYFHAADYDVEAVELFLRTGRPPEVSSVARPTLSTGDTASDVLADAAGTHGDAQGNTESLPAPEA